MQYEQEGFTQKEIPLPEIRGKELLKELSNDIIPVHFHERYPTLLSVLHPVLKRAVAKSHAVSKGELSEKDIVQEELFVVGLPGSGKTTTISVIEEILRLNEVPEEHIYSHGFEKVDTKHLLDRQKDVKAGTMMSDEKMLEANLRAYEQFKAQEGWVIGLGEFVPIVRKKKSVDKETGYEKEIIDGRDGGGTCIQAILQDGIPRNYTVIGQCAESRIDWFANPNRKVGAFANNLPFYHTWSIGVARQLLKQGVRFPSYVQEIVENNLHSADPLHSPDFPHNKLIDPMARYLRDKDIAELEAREFDERIDKSKFFPLKKGERDRKLEDWRLKVARHDVATEVSLHVMDHFFYHDLGIPPQQIFMGITRPPMSSFADTQYNLGDYLDEYAVSDLLPKPNKDT